MFRNFSHLFSAVFLLIAASIYGCAQGADASSRTGAPQQKEELPKGIQESLAKQRIEREKKDFAELLERTDEVLKISEQLEKSYAQHNQFLPEDQKKLDRLEKVIKKIRNEMGGDDEDDDKQAEESPSSISSALENLKINTSKLVDEIKKTSRYSVSVVAVQSSNALLKVVRFLRFRRN